MKYPVFFSLLFAVIMANAQQLPQLTQYQFNDYVINPAVAGSRPSFEFRSGHRYQWIGVTDAPRTYLFSLSTPIAANMGVGGYLFTDIVGPTRRSGFQLSYAYHLKLNDQLRLSFAASGGLLQYQIDGSKIDFHDPGDPVLDDQLRQDMVPDAKFAFYLYADNFWVGATAPQIIQNELAWIEQPGGSLSKLEDHYYVTAGYKWHVNDDWLVTPSVLLKYVEPVPMKLDASAMVSYQNRFWLGGSWRSEDAITAMFGFEVGNTFQFGYSYDMTTTALERYTTGTHELMLGIKVAKTHVSKADSEKGHKSDEAKAEEKARKEAKRKKKSKRGKTSKEKKPAKNKENRGDKGGNGNRDTAPELIIK